MNVLVVGGGGREHALAWKIAGSPLVDRVLCAPGNAGIAGVAECFPVKADDLDGLLTLARREKADLTLVGPEAPLTAGIADRFDAQGLRVFGPTAEAARIEGSKAFAKELMVRQGIPTAASRSFDSRDEADAYVRGVPLPVVVKADGLAAGKGVVVCRTTAEATEAVSAIMGRRVFGTAGDRVVVEEFLEGEEASFLALTDGETVLPLASSQDHKTVFDGDRGPNTGGMGAYSPAPVVTPDLERLVMDQVMLPTVRGMAAAGTPYRGVLYAGLMVTADGPRVLEFNARFGDPETQPIMARMASDLVPLLLACTDGSLSGKSIEWYRSTAVCVVMASGGYPGDYRTGKVIRGLDEASALEGVTVFHAGTTVKDGRVVTAGGRVLGVTGLGATAAEAVERAYRGVSAISFEGAHFRRDIARRALKRT